MIKREDLKWKTLYEEPYSDISIMKIGNFYLLKHSTWNTESGEFTSESMVKLYESDLGDYLDIIANLDPADLGDK